VERIEKTSERDYREGYHEVIRESAEQHTEPLARIAPPAQPTPIIVHVAPTQQEQRYAQPPISTAQPERQRTAPRAEPRAPDQQRVESPDPVQPARAVAGPSEHQEFAGPNQNNSPSPIERVRPEEQNNSPTIPNNSEPAIDSELIAPDNAAPEAGLADFKKLGKIGRQRKYDQLGIDDIEPIKELILFRKEFGTHWPGLSRDMEAYYEKMYFTKPKRGEKDYAKHVNCWKRREQWLNIGTSEP
jgi:hypothetical protein